MNIENIRIIPEEPDYKFSSDEDENTALLWPEMATLDDGSTVQAIHACEHYANTPETFDFLIFNHDMPSTVEEYNEIMQSADQAEVLAI